MDAFFEFVKAQNLELPRFREGIFFLLGVLLLWGRGRKESERKRNMKGSLSFFSSFLTLFFPSSRGYMYATGGGATKYGEAFTQRSGIKLVRSDELRVLISFSFSFSFSFILFLFLAFILIFFFLFSWLIFFLQALVSGVRFLLEADENGFLHSITPLFLFSLTFPSQNHIFILTPMEMMRFNIHLTKKRYSHLLLLLLFLLSYPSSSPPFSLQLYYRL